MSVALENVEAFGALLGEGVAAVAGWLAPLGTRLRDDAPGRWLRFETQLRAATDTPLGSLTARLQLSRFELQCLVLALAPHVEPRLPSIADNTRALLVGELTAGLALEHFCDGPSERLACRRQLLPLATLVRLRILNLSRPASAALPNRVLALSEPALRFLLGEEALSDRIAGLGRLLRPAIDLTSVVLPPEQLAQVQEILDGHDGFRSVIQQWGMGRVLPSGRGVTLLFSGPSGTGKSLLANAMASYAGRPLIRLGAAEVPKEGPIEEALRDLFAEATMRDALVVLDECDALLGRGDPRRGVTLDVMEEFSGIVVLITNHPDRLDDSLERRILYHLPFELPGPELRHQIWEVHLPADVPFAGDIDLQDLAARYEFAGGTIRNAALVAVNKAVVAHSEKPSSESPALSQAMLEDGCRSQLRYALESLTVRTTTHLRLSDIVLDELAERQVRTILAACRNRSTVLGQWGFGERLVTGKGITAIFDGPPGTGKTYCAEILAGELGRPLYRVNIPEVVSKWMGETEKNIREIFQQARLSHAMLLFDEADSLFSARVEQTRTAQDRSANMEVNLLLQEIERFEGVCILTTNFYGALDKALQRRIQYTVRFERPDAGQRARIWRTLVPPRAPLAPDVDFDLLSEDYDLAGGRIKNALLRAAYDACEAGSAITYAILDAACADEYRAAGKLVKALLPDE